MSFNLVHANLVHLLTYLDLLLSSYVFSLYHLFYFSHHFHISFFPSIILEVKTFYIYDFYGFSRNFNMLILLKFKVDQYPIFINNISILEHLNYIHPLPTYLQFSLCIAVLIFYNSTRHCYCATHHQYFYRVKHVSTTCVSLVFFYLLTFWDRFRYIQSIPFIILLAYQWQTLSVEGGVNRAGESNGEKQGQL